MKLLVLLIGMVIVAVLTAKYMTAPSIRAPDGTTHTPSEIMAKTQADVDKINADAAKRATESLHPGEQTAP